MLFSDLNAFVELVFLSFSLCNIITILLIVHRANIRGAVNSCLFSYVSYPKNTISYPSSPILPQICRRPCIVQHLYKRPRCLHNHLHGLRTAPGSPRHGQFTTTVIVELVVGSLLQYIPDERSIFSEALLVAQECCPLVFFVGLGKVFVLAHDSLVEARVELVYESCEVPMPSI